MNTTTPMEFENDPPEQSDLFDYACGDVHRQSQPERPVVVRLRVPVAGGMAAVASSVMVTA